MSNARRYIYGNGAVGATKY